MRIVFMGTPEFAVPPLLAMLERGYEVAAAFTQPDRPAGRGNRLTKCPVKMACEERDVPVYQFERVRKQEGLDAVRALKPDLIVTAAFGQILSQKILDVPPLGVVNVHASLLPRHRGSAPIVQCLLAGEKTTGVTTMFTDRGVDTGDMILRRETDILPGETAGELTERLSHIGAETLLDTLAAIEKGVCPREKQNPDEATYEGMLDKEAGRVDFTKSAREVENLTRAMNPWPGAYTRMGNGVLKIWRARAVDHSGGQPGEVVASSAKKGLFVACGEGAIEIEEMQAPAAKRMPAKAYLLGKPIAEGTMLGGKDEAQ